MASFLRNALAVGKASLFLFRFISTTVAAPVAEAAPWFPKDPFPGYPANPFEPLHPFPVAPSCPYPSTVPVPRPSWGPSPNYPTWGPDSVTCESACLKFSSEMAPYPVTCMESCTNCHTEFWAWLCEFKGGACEVTNWPEVQPPRKLLQSLGHASSSTTSTGPNITAHAGLPSSRNDGPESVNINLPAQTPTPIAGRATSADTCIDACANSDANEDCVRNCERALASFEHAQCLDFTSSCREDDTSLECAEECPVRDGPSGDDHKTHSENVVERRNAQLLPFPLPHDRDEANPVNATLHNVVSRGIVSSTDIDLCVDACGTGCASTFFCNNNILCAQYCFSDAIFFSQAWGLCVSDPVYWPDMCNDIVKHRRKTIIPINFGTDTKCTKPNYPPPGNNGKWKTVDCKKEVMPPIYSACPKCRSHAVVGPTNYTIFEMPTVDGVANDSVPDDSIPTGEEFEQR